VGWCLEPHDLAASKMVAGRPKDGPFVKTMLDLQLIKPGVMITRIGSLPISEDRRLELLGNLNGLVGKQKNQKKPKS